MSLTGNSNEEKIWNFLKSKISNEYGVAALMGNLYAESGLSSTNLENAYESKLGYTDSTYTAAVDNGTYTNFVKDSAGYGLAQWTYYTRKQNLLNYMKQQNLSIGDLEGQLNFLYNELSSSYSSVLTALKSATSILTASNVVLTKYENPANQSSSVQSTRASYGQKYYNKYAGTGLSSSTSSSSTNTSASTDTSTSATLNKTEQWQGKVTASSLNVRTYAGTSYALCSFSPLAKDTIVSVCDSVQASDGSTWYYIKYNNSYGFVSGEYIINTSFSSSSSISSTSSKSVTAKDAAASFDKSIAGTYTTTAKLNMRTGAGTGKTILVTLPKGTKVQNYGYYTKNWLYVQVTYNNILYTGFCSKSYLKK